MSTQTPSTQQSELDSLLCKLIELNGSLNARAANIYDLVNRISDRREPENKQTESPTPSSFIGSMEKQLYILEQTKDKLLWIENFLVEVVGY